MTMQLNANKKLDKLANITIKDRIGYDCFSALKAEFTTNLCGISTSTSNLAFSFIPPFTLIKHS